MLAVKLDQFEGPLDLLLQLIEGEELVITEVSLSQVADQYLSHLAQFSQEHRLEELADFIVIAAKLLLIKSRALTPLLEPEEEGEIEELARQLKMYRAFVDAGKKIDALYRRNRVAFPRRHQLALPAGFLMPPSVRTQTLRDTFARILRAIEAASEKPREIIFPARVSIKEKIEHIIAVLSLRASFRFHEVLSDAQSMADVVVSFMALLELIKQKSIAASQHTLFGDIEITRNTISSDTRGQTLIEVITALAVIAIGLVSVLSLATTNVRNQGIGLSRLIANNLAREGIEVARNIRDTNWLGGEAWYAGLVGDAGRCAVLNMPQTHAFDFVACPSNGASFMSVPYRLIRNAETMTHGSTIISFDAHRQQGSGVAVAGDPTPLYRKVELSPICLVNEEETVDPCAIDDAIGMRVTSEVAWKQSGQDHLVRLRENIYNWR